jgi:hypothetical protein
MLSPAPSGTSAAQAILPLDWNTLFPIPKISAMQFGPRLRVLCLLARVADDAEQFKVRRNP